LLLQLLLHDPQFAGFTRRSTSQPSDHEPLQLPKFAAHEQTPPEQAALAPQLLPQDPQFIGAVRRSTSQPSNHDPLQLP
jgi:hypothetical protein